MKSLKISENIHPISQEFIISSTTTETQEDQITNLREGLKGISAVFDCAINHDLFLEVKELDPQPNSRVKKNKLANNSPEFLSKNMNKIKNLLLKKASKCHEFIKRIIIEGFFKLFSITQLENPEFIW